MNPKNIKSMPGMNQPVISPEAIKSSVDMLCMNEIQAIGEDGQPKPGEFMQCGGEIFVEAHRLKYISPIMSPTGQKTVATLMVGKLCIICGKIFIPEEWQKQHDELEKKETEQSIATKGTILDKDGKPT
ncbi:MAG TPA: hypothetical protein VMZ29_09800 [Candidatus Bathyarchaeia archaeon]|nr:hypothetical protein [Candidatus Bathyarchaeia archaeon]